MEWLLGRPPPVSPVGISIPKGTATSVKDIRPISLTSSVYKILTEVLAQRLKVVMLSSFQSVFIQGPQILDPNLIANEVVEEYKIRGKKFLQLGIEKDFNCVD